MGSLPLHPLVVHLPLGLAVIMPLLAGGLAWAWLTGRLGRPAWLAVVGLQLALVVGAFTALQTGEAEEETVERIVPESAIEAHEEAADLFFWGGVVVLAVAVAAFPIKPGGMQRGLALAAVIGTAVVLFLAIRTGEAGGTLVYEHGAAGAYIVPVAADQGEEAEEGEDGD